MPPRCSRTAGSLSHIHANCRHGDSGSRRPIRVPGGRSKKLANVGSTAMTSFTAHTRACAGSSSRPELHSTCHPLSTSSSGSERSAYKIGSSPVATWLHTMTARMSVRRMSSKTSPPVRLAALLTRQGTRPGHSPAARHHSSDRSGAGISSSGCWPRDSTRLNHSSLRDEGKATPHHGQ